MACTCSERASAAARARRRLPVLCARRTLRSEQLRAQLMLATARSPALSLELLATPECRAARCGVSWLSRHGLVSLEDLSCSRELGRSRHVDGRCGGPCGEGKRCGGGACLAASLRADAAAASAELQLAELELFPG